MPDSKIVLCWYRMSDRVLKKNHCSVNIFKLLFCNGFFYLTIQSTFCLFNLCNGEIKFMKNGKQGLHGGKMQNSSAQSLILFGFS